MHRLMPGGRQVDDRQAAVTKPNPYFGVDPDALVVRAAMRNCVSHPPEHLAISDGRTECPGYAAHDLSVLIG
jgi:hypothetical protein